MLIVPIERFQTRNIVATYWNHSQTGHKKCFICDHLSHETRVKLI